MEIKIGSMNIRGEMEMNTYHYSMVIATVLLSSAVMSIASSSDEQKLQHHLDYTVRHFNKTHGNNQEYIEQLLCVLEAELALVECLQTDQTGTTVEDALYERNQLISVSVPSLFHLYDAIMHVVTYSPLITSRSTYLNYHERMAYFKRMHHILDHYYQELQATQYRAARV